MVECLTRDRRAAGSSLTGVTVLSLSKSINPSLVLVQPRKTGPFITGRLLMGRKESNQTNKASIKCRFSLLSLYVFLYIDRKGYDRSEKKACAQEKGMALKEKGMAQCHSKRA